MSRASGELSGLLACLGVIGLFWICGFIVGVLHRGDELRKEAIENGVAEWHVDSKTGDTEFVWLNCKATQ